MDFNRLEDVTGVILAGGSSRRMGWSKWSLDLAGKKLISWTVQALQPVVGEIIIVKRPEQRIEIPGVKAVNDDLSYPPSALRGIVAGLMESKTGWSFFCGCDMPFIQPELVKFLFVLTSGYKGVVPVLEDGPHPLHSFYHKDLVGQIRENLETNSLKLLEIARQPEVRRVTLEDFAGFNLDTISFFNVNTPEDFRRAEKMIAARRDGSG